MEKGKIVIETTKNTDYKIVNDYLETTTPEQREKLIKKFSNLIKYKLI